MMALVLMEVIGDTGVGDAGSVGDSGGMLWCWC